MSLYFYEVTQTRWPPYCLKCMIGDRSCKSRQISKREIRNSTSSLERAFVLLYLPADDMRTEAFSLTAHFWSL